MNEAGVRKIAGALGISIAAVNTPWLQASCPLAPWTHRNGTDYNPSFGFLANEEGVSYYKCFGCKYKGRLSTLVRQLEHFRDEHYPGLAFEADRLDYMVELPSYEDATSRQAEVVWPDPLNEAAYADLYPSVFDYPECHEYLRNRSVTRSAAEAIDLRYDPEDMRVVFPVRDREGGLYGYTGRTILPEGEVPHTGRQRYPKVFNYPPLKTDALLLGENLFTPGKPILVVEGLFGFAHLVSIGARQICNPVALMGSELTVHKADRLADLGEPVYLLPDNDEAGDHCLSEAVEMLQGNMPFFVPEWPEGKEDPDELTLRDVEILLEDAKGY